MRITHIPDKIRDAGMPFFWQLSMSALFIIIAFIAFFTVDLDIRHTFNILLFPLISIPLLSAVFIKKKHLCPWGFFIVAVMLLMTEELTLSLAYFGVDFLLDKNLWFKEIGMIILGIFSLTLLIIFEKQYRLKGFAIDFILFIVSTLCFIFILSSNLLQYMLYELHSEQQLQFSYLILAIMLIGLLLVNMKLINGYKTKDFISSILILLISTYLFLNAFNSVELLGSSNTLNNIEWFTYKAVAVFSIFHIFTEDYNFDFDPKKSKKLGLQFLWSASIIALLITPMGVIYRWKFNLSPIEPYFVAFISMILSSIVIWRISVLLRNYDKQRKKLKTIAFTDSLTGLPNYLGIRHLIHGKDNMLVFTINIEDFKSINDMYERDFGDLVLLSLAFRLKNISNVLFVARTGSDNFLAIFQVPRNQIDEVYEKLKDKLGVWDYVSNRRIAVPLTFGASYSEHPIPPEKIVRQSELALKESRESHKDFTLYVEKKSILPINYNLPRLELREILQRSIDQNYLPIHFQPIYSLQDGSLKAVELLIRVQSAEHGLLLPGQFLEQAKTYGLLTGLTKVCINMIAMHFDKLPKVEININVPPYMLNNNDILNEFISCFREANLPPERFCVEVTEDGDIPTDQLIPAINLLKENGFSISIDDFGTGYSSLGRLSILPVDSVKIDRSLLLSASNGNKAILESAITLIKRLGVKSVVEGVETLEQLNLVRSLGADSVQGYLFSKPVKAMTATEFSLNASSIVAELQ